jgi:hypothetical protein
MKRSLRAGEWIRRGTGVGVVAAAAAIAPGFDTGVLSRLSVETTTGFEEALLQRAWLTTAPSLDGDTAARDDSAGVLLPVALREPGRLASRLPAESFRIVQAPIEARAHCA